MYKLKPKVIQLLQTDQNIRRSVAMSMGVGEQAISNSITSKYEGRSIAVHHDALNTLIDKTGLIMAEIREVIHE